MTLPELIVFDLDNCVWFPEMYQLWGGGAPFKQKPDGDLTDKSGERVYLMGDIRNIMNELKNDSKYSNVEIAIASCCDEPTWADECLRKFKINENEHLGSVFKYKHIYKGSKANHFRALKKESGFDFDQMIFFDDQTGNCQTVSKLGVTCVLTPHGVTRAHFDKGLEQFAKGKTGTIVRL